MTNRPWMRFFLFSLLSCYIHFTNAAEIVPAESVGMSSSALLDATSRLQQHIDDGELAGVVAAVAQRWQVSLFRIAR